MSAAAVTTLRDACLRTLIAARSRLGDVGFIDTASLQAILARCSGEELATIEDHTRCEQALASRRIPWL
jgi:hypothetical protein